MAEIQAKDPLALRGEPISPGIVTGTAFLFKQINLAALEKIRFTVDDTAKELERLDATIKKTVEQLNATIDRLNHNDSITGIFKAHRGLLEDESFLEEIRDIVVKQKSNIEHVLYSKIRLLEENFRTMEDDAMRVRFLDVQDVYHRILRNLLEIEHVRTNPLKRVKGPVIFVAEKLLPSDLALLDQEKLLGIILEEGNRLSHVAIITRSMGIPAVIRIPGLSALVKSGNTIILDAVEGNVLVNPPAKEILHYQKMEKRYRASSAMREQTGPRGSSTSDGRKIFLEANIGSVKEAEEAVASGADGAGLLRSELFYLSRPNIPSIEEECDYYAAVLAAMKKRPVTVRLLDLGADKKLPYLPSYGEANPQLGMRGIRYLCNNTDLFRRHVRSIVRAAKIGPLRILIPFVTSPGDVTAAVAMVEECCVLENTDRRTLQIGIMVEIPSAALAPRQFLRMTDFVTIGTNDLVQYLFAASREDSTVECYRQNAHPLILGIIGGVVAAARELKKEVSVCGEMASDPLMAPVLVGLGVETFSMQPASIGPVREAVAKRSLAECRSLARKAVRGAELQRAFSPKRSEP